MTKEFDAAFIRCLEDKIRELESTLMLFKNVLWISQKSPIPEERQLKFKEILKEDMPCVQ